MNRIKILDLDPDFHPTNHEQIKHTLFTFSGGEVHLHIDECIDFLGGVIITHRIRSMNDLMSIALAKEIFDNKRIPVLHLIIPYIPYARQDRRCVENDSFSLKIFANILNSLNFAKIYAIHVHSIVSNALINNLEEIPYKPYVKLAMEYVCQTNRNSGGNLVLISPDAGAYKNNRKIYEEMGSRYFCDMVLCDKVRDADNGDISKIKVFSDNLSDANCLVVDDICDGGRTFIGIGGVLKSLGVKNMYLYVTHGIFSRGYEELFKYYSKIFTTNSFQNIKQNNIIQYGLHYEG